VQPKPTREPEVIKEIKEKKFNKMQMKKASSDYKVMVDNRNSESVVEFVNVNLKTERKWNPITWQNGQSFDHKDVTDENDRVVKHVTDLIEGLQKDPKVGTKRYNVPAVLVICADTYNVVDLNKLFVEKYKALLSSAEAKAKYPYDVHV
jgi:hypothetical protein